MAKENSALIVAILDRSGSMSSMASEAIGGFNSFLEDQKKEPGSAVFSLVLFDNEYEVVEDFRDIQAVEPLTEKTYFARGTTALLDAVGRTIDSVGARLDGMPEEERPARVLFCIVTDGMENASKEYTGAQIKEKITRQQDQYRWAFLFLAADQDAFAAGGAMGVAANTTSNYANTSAGNAQMYASVSCAAKCFRSTGDASIKDASQ